MDKKPIIPSDPKAVGEILANRLFSFFTTFGISYGEKK
jgi:hypothetical protein